MNSKISRIGSASEAAALASPWGMFADLGRKQLALATESASAMFRGSEAMRKIQQAAAHQASARHQAVEQRLHGDCTPADLASIQTALLRENMQEAAQYWQELAAVALQTQFEMIGCVNHALSNGGSEGGLGQMFGAWQNMVSRSLNGTNGGTP
ncbi:MAG: hypothetical protein OJF60_002104 [Burkholderiaceae bacterium]|nr:MAG: hypothetical protein OJF60_002104 [Burkholderiaceae bacterium]